MFHFLEYKMLSQEYCLSCISDMWFIVAAVTTAIDAENVGVVVVFYCCCVLLTNIFSVKWIVKNVRTNQLSFESKNDCDNDNANQSYELFFTTPIHKWICWKESVQWINIYIPRLQTLWLAIIEPYTMTLWMWTRTHHGNMHTMCLCVLFMFLSLAHFPYCFLTWPFYLSICIHVVLIGFSP